MGIYGHKSVIVYIKSSRIENTRIKIYTTYRIAGTNDNAKYEVPHVDYLYLCSHKYAAEMNGAHQKM